MKVLMINGSSHAEGCTYTALVEIGRILNENYIETEIVQLGIAPIRDCTGCRACAALDNKCVYDDDIVNDIIEKAKTSDGFVFGSPVFYAHPTGRLLCALDRMFYSSSRVFRFKPAAAIVSARRAGTTAAIDVINKYFTINQMPVVSSTYWNMVHGRTASDVAKDEEGLQTMRNIGHNMAWILKLIAQNGGAEPRFDTGNVTDFIR